MTDSNVIFRTIWRLNAILLLAACLIVVVIAGRFFLGSFSRYDRDSSVPDVSSATAKKETEVDPTLGDFARADNAIFKASVLAWAEKGGGNKMYGYSMQPPVVNVIFADSATGTIRRLFPNDSGLVTGQSEIRDLDSPTLRGGKVVARVFYYVSKDTNGDQRLSPEDRFDIYLTRPDGTGAAKIVENVDSAETDFANGLDGLKTAMVARRDGVPMIVDIDLASLSVTRQIEVRLPRQ